MADLSSLLVLPSFLPATIKSTLKRLHRLLSGARCITSDPSKPLPSLWLAELEVVARDVDFFLDDLHYPLLMDAVDSSSKMSSYSLATMRFGDLADSFDMSVLKLEKLLRLGRIAPAPADPAGGDASSVAREVVDGLMLRDILVIRSILGPGEIGGASMSIRSFDMSPIATGSLLYLDLSRCGNLQELPASLVTLHHLYFLSLSCCYRLRSLPESLGELRNLNLLILSSCRELKDIPESLCNLFRLRCLDLSGCCSLQVLPQSFGELGHLQNLNLSDCYELKELPESFGNLRELQCLKLLSCAKLQIHVEYLNKLPNLNCLNLSPYVDLREYLGDSTNLLDLAKWWKINGFRQKCIHQTACSPTCGREDDRKNIMEMLLSDSSAKGNVTAICIIGESGAGKTELVRLLYNDQRVLNAFDIRMWISVSEKFDGKKLMVEIIEFATSAYCGAAQSSFLDEIVKEELMGKRFLLVLDDVEIENNSFWSNVFSILNVGAKGSALIIATRSKTVASLAGVQSYYLNPLSEEQCLLIFQEHACGGCDISSHPHLSKIGRQLVGKCRGNPLCVKALSGLLCHAESGLWEIDNLEGETLQALRLCFNLLPLHLKQCFAFCSLFPKDYIFVKHHIVRLWVSQGYIEDEAGTEPEDIGLQYFNELFCRSFFQYSPFHDDKEDKFVMHELFRNLAQSVSKNEHFKSEDDLCSIGENISHLSLVPSESDTIGLKHLTKVRHLETFLVVSRSELQCCNTSSPILSLVGFDDFFMSRCSFLRTLNLSYTDIEELPTSIGSLKCLQYLALNNTNIRDLPFEICGLYRLQTLELKDCCNLVELPESMKNLTKLRHLDVRKELGYVGMPSGIGQLTDLQTLAIFNVGNDLLHCSIRELRNLCGMKGSLHITGLENIKADNDAKEANLKSKMYLEALILQWCCSSIYIEGEDGEDIADQVLESLQPNSNLRELIIQNYTGKNFPIWMQDSCLSNLVSVTLDNCFNCVVLPSLGELPSLKYLCVRKMYAVRRFGHAISLAEGKCIQKFPSLELLKLWEMYELQEWIGIMDGSFPRLCSLSVSRCPNLRYLPPLPSLVDLSFHCCTKLPLFPILPSLESLKIEGFQNMKSLNLLNKLPKLKKLEISDCKELSSGVELSSLTSLEKLKIVRCPKLNLDNDLQQYHLKRRRITRRSKLSQSVRHVRVQHGLMDLDDGFSWRKYGQKDIISGHPRSYFRCIRMPSLGCPAKRQVQRSNDDPNLLEVSYQGEHVHPPEKEMGSFDPQHQIRFVSTHDATIDPGISVEEISAPQLQKLPEFAHASPEMGIEMGMDEASTCTSLSSDIMFDELMTDSWSPI